MTSSAPRSNWQAPQQRVVIPEWLDELPPEHPDAQASRRDLIRINQLMGNYRFIRRHLIRVARPGDVCVELGAGGGQLTNSLQPAEVACPVTGLDLAPRPHSWPTDWDWQQQDIFHSTTLAKAEIVVASLILHHFETEALQTLGTELTRNARVLIITEPLRASYAHFLGHFMDLTGINRVTRHDMHVSIDAGFHKGELPTLLGLTRDQWKINESVDWRGSLRMLAYRV
jgi:2-polyprenyl-3-methyl-5-hydroxy-6-metoxy-1,4-benzoquinol methylase